MILTNRSDFMPTVVSNGIPEKDFILNHWDEFITKRQVTYFQMTEREIQRPDLISLSAYGDMNYWWIILKFNGIMDPWNDLTPGDILSIPDISDIDTFMSQITS